MRCGKADPISRKGNLFAMYSQISKEESPHTKRKNKINQKTVNSNINDGPKNRIC